MSSVRLLQLRGRSNGWAQPIELNVKNYIGAGNSSYTGYGATLLKNQDPSLWQRVTNVFTTQWDSNYVRALITPGPVTNVSGSFKGLSTLFFGKWQTGAIMSDNQTILNGGWSSTFSWIGAPSVSSYDLTYDLQYSPTFGYSFVYNNFTIAQPRFDFSRYDLLTLTATNGIAKIAFTPYQTTQGSLAAGVLNLGNVSTASAIKTAKDSGWLGQAWAGAQQAKSVVADPVQIVSGDFCADNVDLTLAGPMPLQLRRNYQSRNVADNQFGYGWKMGVMPWLVLTTNAAGDQIIYAAEMDGSLLAYRYQSNNVWTVQPTNNPTLANFTSTGIGSVANSFNNRIEQNQTNNALYVLTAADGSKRTYQVMTSFGIDSGTNHLSRIRPYLTKWEDHAGNYYSFNYGTNSSADDFGELNRIVGADGTFLALKYDIYGRVTDAFTDDSRHVLYQYDQYGDLSSVKLPDDSTWQYQYQHYTFTTNSQTYVDSNHLLAQETKPDGRLLANTYDSLRRVTIQAASVGTNRELVTNAWIFYTNSCTGLTNDSITGTTRVEDVFHNPTIYSYTNNLITRIDEPLGRTTIQDWFETTETNKAGYYPRSLEMVVDVRGLTNKFFYDGNGNVTNLTINGDLTGEGITSQSATATYTYTTNNLFATATDPVSNRVAYFYDGTSDSFSSHAWKEAVAGLESPRTDSFTRMLLQLWTWAYGLRQTVPSDCASGQFVEIQRRTNGFTTVAAFQYNPSDMHSQRTFRATPIRQSQTISPTRRAGDTYEVADARGRRIRVNYDAVGRAQWRDVFDENTNALSHEAFYYNRNGELEWYDGPRSNPDDYTYFDYDGAGRKVQEIRWRSRAKTDGTGVEAETGDNLYATTFYSYDPFGNLTKLIDPRGAVTTNTWDALGRLVQRKSLDTNGSTVLATEGFSYESGGLVRFYTNALGGVTETRYTSAGQPGFRQNADGSTNGWIYYLDGRIRREIQGNGSYLETTYSDVSRTISRIFYSVAGSPLATNVSVFDQRGNLIQRTDAANNVFVSTYDGLDRLKIAAGPAVVTVTENCQIPGCGVYVTNVLQQAVTNYYDSAGVSMTNVNALGEKAVRFFDALGRTVGAQVYASGAGSPSRTVAVAYAPDNNSITVTEGSGANVISTSAYTDADNHTVTFHCISICKYP